MRQLVRDHAERVLLTQHTAFLDQVEKYPLNAEQRLAVVRTNDRNLILAAAGTGKTSVIVAKALYLLQSGAALPEDILIMAYNKAAAEELKERLNACAERAGIDGSNVQASTFHALGRSVLVDCDCAARVSVLATDEHAFSDWLNRWLFSYLTVDPARIQQFINLFMGSVLFDQVLKEHTLQSEHTEAKEQEALLQAPPELYRTLNNEKVKSRQEVHIANWLATHGVPYHYEERYVTKLRLVPDFDYKPDFHIIRPRAAGSAPDDEPPIYLEHYGIDREGNTKPGIDKDAYNALIERKRQVHQENGTILLETFSYEFSEKTIDDRLEELMKSVGIPLRPVSPEELLQKIKGNKGFGELNELLKRCVQVIREFNYSRNDLLQRYQDAGLRYATDYADFFAQLVSDYQSYLNERGEIDFCDMIVRASELVAEGSFSRSWRYILVDEFQDISLSRLQLLQGLLKCNPKCVLTCVGDDWQAIYHFAGGILDATVHFDRYFGSYTLTKLVQTYRYPPSIAATAGTFVQENPQQFRKDVVSLQEDSGVKVHLLDAKEMGALTVSSLFCHKLRGLNYVHSAITSAIAALYQVQFILKQHPDATVAVISRYNKVLAGISSYLEHINDFPANALLNQDPPLELTEDESRAAGLVQQGAGEDDVLHFAGGQMFPGEAGDEGIARGDPDLAVPADAVDSEEKVAPPVYPVGADVLGDGVGDAVAVFHFQHRAVLLCRAQDVVGGGSPGPLALGGDEVHQVMDMGHIAAGKDAGHGGLHIFIDHRAVGSGIDGDARLAGQLIFGDEAHGEQQGVAVKHHLGTGDGLTAFIHLRDHHLLHPVPSSDIGDRMGEVEGNVVVVETLDDVSVQTAGVGHDLHAGQDLCALQSHAAGHDEADVAAAQDDHPAAGQPALHIDVALGRASGKYAGRPLAGDGDGAPGPLPAAHGQNDGLCLLDVIPGVLAHHVDLPVRGDGEHHGVQPYLHAGVLQHVNETPGIFRAGQLLLKVVEAEAVVDTLIEDAAQFLVPLHDEDALHALFPGGAGRGQSGGAAADDDQIIHGLNLPWSGWPEASCLPCPERCGRGSRPVHGPGSPPPGDRRSRPDSGPCRRPPDA